MCVLECIWVCLCASVRLLVRSFIRSLFHGLIFPARSLWYNRFSLLNSSNWLNTPYSHSKEFGTFSLFVFFPFSFFYLENKIMYRIFEMIFFPHYDFSPLQYFGISNQYHGPLAVKQFICQFVKRPLFMHEFLQIW